MISKLTLEYDGTPFVGWAAQPGRRTVAGVLSEALARLVGAETPLGLTVAGRTDAGVHATGQVCHIDLPAEEWERVVAVNLFGTAAVVRAALPALKESRGKIVTVASTLGLRALPDATAYCASKFGVVGMTRALATELAGQVGVTLLVPGGMNTAFFDGRPDQYKPGPDAQLNDPADVADAVVFALTRSNGCELREMVVCQSTEPSWP